MPFVAPGAARTRRTRTRSPNPPPPPAPTRSPSPTRAAAGPTPATRSGRRPTRRLMPDLPSGHVDKIDIEQVIRNQSTQVNDVEQGKLELDLRPAADRPLRRGQEQVRGHPVPGRADGQHLLLLDEHDTQAARSTTCKVRQAVNYAVDPTALERIYTGQIDADPADPAARHARLQEVRAVPAQHGQGEGS